MRVALPVRDVWTKHPGYQLAWFINVVAALYLGVTAITMPGRFTAVTYDALRESLGIVGWGLLLAAYAAALAVCSWLHASALIATFFLGGIGYILLAVWFLVGLADPHASPWGGLFFFIGCWQLTQWIAYRQSARELAEEAEKQG